MLALLWPIQMHGATALASVAVQVTTTVARRLRDLLSVVMVDGLGEPLLVERQR